MKVYLPIPEYLWIWRNSAFNNNLILEEDEVTQNKKPLLLNTEAEMNMNSFPFRFNHGPNILEEGARCNKIKKECSSHIYLHKFPSF